MSFVPAFRKVAMCQAGIAVIPSMSFYGGFGDFASDGRSLGGL
jgi:hypothetical protein